MKKYLFMLLALCLMPANNTAQILNSLKDIIRPTDPSLIRTLNGQWDFYFINGADWKEQACFYQPDYDISSCMGHRTKRFFQWSGKMGERF